MRVLPTTYCGLKFRSRAEARWAVFFDQLELTYHYEPEGFELPSGRYLPDFFLPDLRAYFEVKGRRPTYNEMKLADELAIFTGRYVIISHGPPNPKRAGLEGDFSTFCPEMSIDGEPFADWHVGGFVYGRRDDHPACSFHLGNLGFLPCHHSKDLKQAFEAATNCRFGIFG